MRYMMSSRLAMLVLSLGAIIFVAACGTTTASTASTPTTTTTPTTATATPTTSGPTSVPIASVAKCGQLLSLNEANQATHPVGPATTILAMEVSGTALCSYESAKYQPDLGMIFKAYSGGNLAQNVQQALSGSLSQVTLTNSQSVSGVGDQALYVTITGTSTVNGVAIPVKENILFVVVGTVSFGIINTIYNNVDPLGSPSAATVLSDFEQVAGLVIGRL